MHRLISKAYGWQREFSWRRLAANINGLIWAVLWLAAVLALTVMGIVG